MAKVLDSLRKLRIELLGGRVEVDRQLLQKRGHFGTRRFHRHDLADLGIAFLEFGDYYLPLLNVSLAGAMIAADSALFETIFQAGSRFKARLHVLGYYHPLIFSVAHLQQQRVGLRVELQQNTDLRFLQEFIRFMDAGIVLQILSKQKVSNYFRGPQWHSYGQDGVNVEVHLDLNRAGVLREASIAYRENRRYEYCRFTRSGIQTKCSTKKHLTPSEKKLILRNSILILTGLRQIGNTDRLDAAIRSGVQVMAR